MARPKKNIEEAFKDTRKDIFGETAINSIAGEDFITFYSSERWGIKFAEECLAEHPEDCKLMYRTTTDDGKVDSIQITMPAKSIRYIKYPTKREFTEEQRKAASERMKNMRRKSKD